MESWLARAARVFSERTALITASGEDYTYSGLFQRAQSVAGALVKWGVRRGDRVGLALPGSELAVALHGCLLIGAVAVPIDLRLQPSERAPRLAGTKLLLEELPRGPIAEPVEVDAADTATLMFTSGTTAAPKEVALSYENWHWNAIGSALALGLGPGERWLCPMPLAHVGGLSIQIRSLIYGTTVILHDRFDTASIQAELQDRARGVTLVSLVPTMLSRLLAAGLENPPTLRCALLGGGPISPALLERAQAAGISVAPSYGMTEGCSQIVTRGWPLFGVEIQIEGAGASRRATEVGEILVRGGNVATRSLAPDGWLHTGDLGRLDEEGKLVVEGRAGDMIITGGENVAPDEIEAVLLEHPAVTDAAVFGRSDPEWGEVVTAQVVVRDGEAEPDELRQHCAARLAPFKVPKQLEFVSALPHGTTGKLLRRELR